MEKISSYQGALIVCAFTLNSTLISVPGQMIGKSKQDAWLSYILAMIIPLTAWCMISKVLARYPEQDLFTVMIHRLPFVGKLMGVLYLLFFLMILARDIRLLSDFINIIILQKTPMLVISVLAIVTAIFMVRGGIELIGRTAEIYQVVLNVVVLTLPLFLMREFQIRDFLPFFEGGWVAILQGSWFPVAYLGEMVAFAFMFSSKQLPFRGGIFGIIMGVFLLEILILFNITVLGPELAPRFMFPNQEMIREIRITDFLDRLDLPIIGIWMPAMIVKIGCGLYLVCHGIKRLFPKLSPKPLVAPVGFFSMVCSYWFFSDAIQTLNLNKSWPVVALFFEWLVPFLLFIILRPRRKRIMGTKNPAQKSASKA